ncbi:hypothetical protein [Paracoccus sp. NSM]|uniref:hypothetical protein n=1 Tax=Paracoccus sp. NSM TaxID=3457784 RepID=UPI00403736A5
MLNAKMKSAMIAGKAALVATLLGSAAYAQVSVDTPAGNTVDVPETALEGQASAATTADTGHEALAQAANDEAIRNALESQGFGNVLITRDGTTLTVTADRAGEMVELVYSTATGRLITVDGVPVGPDEADFVVIDDPATAPADQTPPADTVGNGGTTQPGLPGETDGGEPTTMPDDDATLTGPDATQPGIPGETDGSEPEATIGTDVSDPGATGGEDAAEAEGIADTDGQD